MRKCGATRPRAGDEQSQTTWLHVRVKQLMLSSSDYFGLSKLTAAQRIVYSPGMVHKAKKRQL